MTRSAAFPPARKAQHGEASKILRFLVVAAVVLSICWLTGCALLDPSSTAKKTTSTGHLTVTSSHDSLGTFENWFVDASTGLSSNHVFSTVQ